MHKDTLCELTRVAQFLGVPTTAEMLQRTIANSSSERMRKMEKEQEDQWIATKKHRKDIPFVRVTKRSWKTDLPERSVQQIEAAWGDLMISLGYPLVTDRAPDGQLASSSPVPY